MIVSNSHIDLLILYYFLLIILFMFINNHTCTYFDLCKSTYKNMKYITRYSKTYNLQNTSFDSECSLDLNFHNFSSRDKTKSKSELSTRNS